MISSIKRTSSILVFRNVTTTAVDALAAAPDLGSLQVVGDGALGYSRGLAVADALNSEPILRQVAIPIVGRVFVSGARIFGKVDSPGLSRLVVGVVLQVQLMLV